jgi:LacI family transcriptional regulator, galactose operon repressor
MSSMRAERSDSPVTLRDVARAAGVHPATASRALNPETRSLVSEATAQRVQEVARELGYHPNPIARGLKTNRSHTIGVLVPDLMNPLFAAIVRGIEAVLDEAGYTPLITNTDNDPERERIDFKAMRMRQVDGFITATAHRDHRLITESVGPDATVVLVNRRVDDNALPAVSADDVAGARLAVEHLAALGHRRIAHLAGPLDLSTGHQRHEGFMTTMRALGLEPDPDLIAIGDNFTEASGARICRELIGRKAEFTAIVAGNDLMALGCYDALAEHGLVCPDDVSVVGFNDMPFAARFNPPLTTVRIPHYEMGSKSAELLLEVLQDPDAPPRQVLLQSELVARGSSAPPRSPVPA